MRALAALFVAALAALLFPTPASAVTLDDTVRVTRAQYHGLTQDSLSKCGSGFADPSENKYVAPKPPAAVLADVANDKATDRDWYNKYKGFERVSHANLTGNGLPTVIWRASVPDIRDLYIPYLNTTVQVKHYEYRYHAWVPGIFAGCSVWSEIEYVD